MIHQVDDGFVISSGGRWLPGLYATRAAAQWAFRFSDEALVDLRDQANRANRAITTEDLRAHTPRHHYGEPPSHLKHGTRPNSGVSR